MNSTETDADTKLQLQLLKVSQDGDVTTHQNHFTFNPYNECNTEVSKRQIDQILRKYGVHCGVHNVSLYKRAFVHKSYIKRPAIINNARSIHIVNRPHNCMPLKTKSNERLEYLGDGIVECITKYYLYRRFPKENEGFMTNKKIALVNNESLGKLTYEMGLNKWYILSKNAEDKKTRTNLKKLGCLFEAFLGALFLDVNKIKIKDENKWFDNVFCTGPGFQMAQIFLENVYEQHVNWTNLLINNENYKNIFQVLIQKEFKTTPIYLEVEPYTVNNEYNMGVYLCIGLKHYNQNIHAAIPFSKFKCLKEIHKYIKEHHKIYVFFSNSSHKIKKKAEQRACKAALEMVESQ
jgi:ribonuclease-3